MGIPSIHRKLEQGTGVNSTQRGAAPLLPMLDDSPACTCPGDSHPIPFSVHLSRLASGYSLCHDCGHKSATGKGTPGGRPPIRARAADRSLITSEGVRGAYLNELDRTRATVWGAAFASILWDERPRLGRIGRTTSFNEPTSPTVLDSSPGQAIPVLSPRGPVVVIGFDERPSSPEMITGVAIGLRRMGCQVIDLGQTIRPCFQFAIHHLNAAGGIYVTGDGFDPAWTGFHFVGPGAIPWTDDAVLSDLESRARTMPARPTRCAGSQRPFHASLPYQANLWKLFHALRPLQVVCGAASRQLPRVLETLFARLPCKLIHEPLPIRSRKLDQGQDVDVRRVASATVAGGHHLGVVIDDDGERCAFVTEQGELVTTGELAQLLVLLELHESRAVRLVVDEPLHDELARRLATLGTRCSLERAQPFRLPRCLSESDAELGITQDHRIWFNGDYPASDAIRTMARVMQALSLSDAPMSRVLQPLT